MSKKLVVNNIEVGKRMKAVRLEHNLTQEKIVEKMGMSSIPHYQSMENGRCRISLRVLLFFKEELGASTDFILYGETHSGKDFVLEFETYSVDEQMKWLNKILRNI